MMIAPEVTKIAIIIHEWNVLVGQKMILTHFQRQGYPACAYIYRIYEAMNIAYLYHSSSLVSIFTSMFIYVNG